VDCGVFTCFRVAGVSVTPPVLATNGREGPASMVAAHDKARWDIELFKLIRQHLRLKRFLGRSERAVKLQILTTAMSINDDDVRASACSVKAALRMRCQDKQKVCRTAVGLRRDDGQRRAQGRCFMRAPWRG
jgi:hypothetical protein